MSEYSRAVMQDVVNKLRFPKEGEKAITKKLACEMLGINYNTTRLDKLVDEFLEEKQRRIDRVAANRGKPVTDHEVSCIIEDYLTGESLSSTSERLCRSILFIKNVLNRCGIPLRDASATYFRPQLLDENFLREELTEGEVVYSARHQELGTIQREAKSAAGKAYWVYLASEQKVALMWYDVLPMQHLIEKYKLKLVLSQNLDVRTILAQTLSKAFKHEK